MRILVTGGQGFLGKHVCRILKDRGYEVHDPSHENMDLMNKEFVEWVFKRHHMDVVVHLAAVVGGIGANQKRPAEFFYQNASMGIDLMHTAWQFDASKFVAVGTVCAYPKHTPLPFKEEDLWNGYPEETNAPYGLAKKMLLVQAQAYRQQYGFNAIYLLPVNLYGPGDNFDPRSSHVIPALIRKIEEAIQHDDREVNCWGTGKATREFLYVEDCAKGICDALEQYDSPEPMNLGTGQEISIGALVELIGELMGYKGIFKWDESKPDGQPARMLDITRAQENIDWKPAVGLKEGLKRTIDWWRTNGSN